MKSYRVYYNKASEFPHVFSVDEGSHASEVCFQAVEVKTGGVMQFNPNAEYPEPKCWLACQGALHIEKGKATIYVAPHADFLP